MKHILVVAFATVIMGCVSTNATMLNPTPSGRAPIPEAQVRIFRTASQVTGKYEEVALLNATGESNWTNEQKMMESMRKKAASLGANGVILDDIKEAGAGAKVAAAIFGTGTQRKGRAIAIFVFPDSTAKDR